MAGTTQHLTSLYVDQFGAGSVSLPAGCINDSHLADGSTGNFVEGEKLEHQSVGIGSCYALADPATTVTAVTKYAFTAHKVGELVAFGALVNTVATGADRTITVDLKKAAAGSNTFATVLSATVGFTNASVVNTLVVGTISSTAYVAGDTFELVVTVAGSASAQALGLLAKLCVREEPQ